MIFCDGAVSVQDLSATAGAYQITFEPRRATVASIAKAMAALAEHDPTAVVLWIVEGDTGLLTIEAV